MSELELVEFGDLTDAGRAQLEGDEVDPFDAADGTLVFRPKERHLALRDPAGRLVAAAGLTGAEVQVGEAHFAVVGLGGVIVNAQHRGQGLARRVVEAALKRARTMGPDFMVLFCHPDRAGLYDRLGFIRIEGTVLVQQPSGAAPMTQLTMWQALRPGVAWPPGQVVIQTLPF